MFSTLSSDGHKKWSSFLKEQTTESLTDKSKLAKDFVSLIVA